MSLVDSLGEAVTGKRPIRATVEDTRPSLPSGFLRSIIDMRDATPELARHAAPGLVHVSSLANVCTRQWNLMLEQDLRTEDVVTGSHRVMWAIGRAVETHIRGQLITGYPANVYGVWRCACGAVEHTGFKPVNASPCGKCDTRMHVYHEVTLVDHENGVVGNPDVVLLHETKYLAVEIKSMNIKDWKELTQPLPAHVAQVLSYRRLLRLAGRPVHDDVALIYCAKDFAWGSPYKEFHVKGSLAANEARIDHLFAKAREIKEHSEAGTLPPRTVCRSLGSSRAKSCPVAHVCFMRDPA